jgi:hypothetical protein
MPMFDYRCTDGHEFEACVPSGTDAMLCRQCSSLAERVWRGMAAVIGDECDFIDDNLSRHPIRIRSKTEHRRLMKEKGVQLGVKHVGLPGSDKSPHTTRWF